MRTVKPEPVEQEIEELVIDEERAVIAKLTVPDDVKAEILERLERFHERDEEREQGEDARAEP